MAMENQTPLEVIIKRKGHIQVKCPSCDKIIPVNSDNRLEICQYCNSPFIVKEALQYLETSIKEIHNNKAEETHYQIDEELISTLQQKGLKPDDIAVSHCRLSAGSVITAIDLESNEIVSDLCEFNLISFPGDPITIGEAIGKKLTTSIDALTAITKEMIYQAKD